MFRRSSPRATKSFKLINAGISSSKITGSLKYHLSVFFYLNLGSCILWCTSQTLKLTASIGKRVKTKFEDWLMELVKYALCDPIIKYNNSNSIKLAYVMSLWPRCISLGQGTLTPLYLEGELSLYHQPPEKPV